MYENETCQMWQEGQKENLNFKTLKSDLLKLIRALLSGDDVGI